MIASEWVETLNHLAKTAERTKRQYQHLNSTVSVLPDNSLHLALREASSSTSQDPRGDAYRFNKAVQFLTTSMGVDPLASVIVLIRKRWPSAATT